MKLKLCFLLSLCAIPFLIGGCSSHKYPGPSNQFYVNDYAGVLTAEVKDEIIYYSDKLYEETKGIGYGGTQVVVATFLFNSEEEMNLYRREEIYNQWEIGQNDMGLLIIMSYINVEYDGYHLPNFEKFEVAIGTGLTQYFTEIDAGVLMYDTIFPLYDDEELALLHFYYESLHRIYRDAYPNIFEEFYYQSDLSYFIQLFEDGDYTFNSVAISPRSFWEDIFTLSFLFQDNLIFWIIGISLLLGKGFFSVIGGGGRSQGAGIFRRRR